jgi:hypothetical protein
MGAVWLLNLPTWLREGGLTVEEYPNWATTSRSSGGYDAVWAIGVHHTASSTTPANDLNYMLNNADAKPIGALYLARDGVVTVCAGGATNTQGRGGPYKTSKGTIPLDAGNRYMLSIEAAWNSNETWPEVQQVAYTKLCHILVQKLGLAWGDIVSHAEWTSRKYDPAGESKYAKGNALWDMDKFRGDCWLAYADTEDVPEPPPAPPAPEPDLPTPPPSDDVVAKSDLEWYVKKGDSPWSVASTAYGDGSKHTELDASAFNSYSTASKPVFVTVPGISGHQSFVKDGEGVASVIRRLVGSTAWPTNHQFDSFADWNGGSGRNFYPGDAVSMPD